MTRISCLISWKIEKGKATRKIVLLSINFFVSACNTKRSFASSINFSLRFSSHTFPQKAHNFVALGWKENFIQEKGGPEKKEKLFSIDRNNGFKKQFMSICFPFLWRLHFKIFGILNEFTWIYNHLISFKNGSFEKSYRYSNLNGL